MTRISKESISISFAAILTRCCYGIQRTRNPVEEIEEDYERRWGPISGIICCATSSQVSFNPQRSDTNRRRHYKQQAGVSCQQQWSCGHELEEIDMGYSWHERYIKA